MLTRVAFLGVSALTLLLAWLFRTPPAPGENVETRPVFVLGACGVLVLVVVIRAVGKNIARGSRSEAPSFVYGV